MARALRIEYPGAVYHITARGNEKKNIFVDEKDYIKLLNIFKESQIKYFIKIYAYVLMQNHYHLLFETPKANLIKVMHYIQSKYSIYFNRRHNRVGHLFQGRYKALLVDKDNYLLELVRYIHLNPIRAGRVVKPEQYRWSSYKEYLGCQKLVNIKDILKIFGGNRERFKRFTYDGINKKWEDINCNVYGQVIFGTKQFTDTIKKRIKKAGKLNIDKEISFRRKMKKRVSKEKIIDLVIKHFKIRKEKLFNKKDRWNEPRKICIYLIKKFTDMPIKLIGNLFGGVQYSAVSHIAKKVELRRNKDKELDNIIRKIESKIKT